MNDTKNPVSNNLSLIKQQELLRMEYEYEKAQYLEMSGKTSIEKNIQTGRCWYPVRIGRSFYNSVNQYVIEVFRNPSEVEESELEPGRSVCFFENRGNERKFIGNIIGTISLVDENRMLVVVPAESAKTILMNAENPGVQLYFDETSYKAMFAALNRSANAKNNRLAELRDIICGNVKPEFRTDFPVRFPWLNKSQERAVQKVLGVRDISIVHGPPGTGKTTTLVEAIYETLRREEQVIVSAQSNAAVDWIAEKLIERGISVLRVGNPLKVSDALLNATYERRYEAHPDYHELWSLRKNLREILSSKDRHEPSKQNRIYKIKNRITEIEIKIDADIFAETKVVACTLVGSANRVLERKYFNTLFVDEAAQALDAACWIPISKVNRVVFAGDHFQLPPTVKCMEAKNEGLDITMMEKLARKYPDIVTLLNVQYRMNSDIMRFSSDWFYEGDLKADPSVAERTLTSLDYPIEWYDTRNMEFREEQNSDTMSRINKEEAELLISLFENLVQTLTVEKIRDENIDIGIISPYKKQIGYIRHLVKRNKLLRSIKKNISINTVDGFQGQEKDIIMISMVRGNDQGKIGFLNDLRRMNVAITRARMKLIILGDAETLNHHAFYRKLYEYIRENGKITELEKEKDS